MPEKRFIGIEECAEYLGLTVGTLYVWTHQRKIPHFKFGKRVKFDLRELEGWIRKKRVKVYEYKPLEL
ncbi:MAG: helix-turn-helix domain-containing protein [Candidatus Omnitrophota bacterium]